MDVEVSDQSRLAGLRASLSEEFAVQTARLKELTEISGLFEVERGSRLKLTRE